MYSLSVYNTLIYRHFNNMMVLYSYWFSMCFHFKSKYPYALVYTLPRNFRSFPTWKTVFVCIRIIQCIRDWLLLLLRYCWIGIRNSQSKFEIPISNRAAAIAAQTTINSVPRCRYYSFKAKSTHLVSCSSVQARRLARTDVSRTYFFTYHEHPHTGTFSLVGITDVSPTSTIPSIPTTHPLHLVSPTLHTHIHTLSVYLFIFFVLTFEYILHKCVPWSIDSRATVCPLISMGLLMTYKLTARGHSAENHKYTAADVQCRRWLCECVGGWKLMSVCEGIFFCGVTPAKHFPQPIWINLC